MHFLDGNLGILIQISLKFVPDGQIDKNPVLVQIMAWRETGDEPWSESGMDGLVYPRIYVSLGLDELRVDTEVCYTKALQDSQQKVCEQIFPFHSIKCNKKNIIIKFLPMHKVPPNPMHLWHVQNFMRIGCAIFESYHAPSFDFERK